MAPRAVGRANRLYKPLRQNSIDVSGLRVLLSNKMPAERSSRSSVPGAAAQIWPDGTDV